jgi:hypothetical protein
MNYENKSFSVESETFYKSVTRLTFNPIREVTWAHPYRKKGDVIYRRNLFTLFRKRVKKVITEDIYREYGWHEHYDYTASEYAERNGYLIIDGKMHQRASVVIETSTSKDNRILQFDTNTEALSYIASLKENCKKCENNLL